MGLATIDPHSQKEHTEIDKIPKFGVNRASFEIRINPDICPDLSGFVRISIHFFVIFLPF